MKAKHDWERDRTNKTSKLLEQIGGKRSWPKKLSSPLWPKDRLGWWLYTMISLSSPYLLTIHYTPNETFEVSSCCEMQETAPTNLILVWKVDMSWAKLVPLMTLENRMRWTSSSPNSNLKAFDILMTRHWKVAAAVNCFNQCKNFHWDAYTGSINVKVKIKYTLSLPIP